MLPLKSRNPRPTALLTDGRLTFQPGVKDVIDITDDKVKQLKGRILSLSRRPGPDGDVLGTDAATQAGYRDDDRTRIMALVRESQIAKETSKSIERDIRLAKRAYAAKENSLPVVASNEDEETRFNVAKRIILHLIQSPTNFHVLLRGLGVEVNTEIQNSLQLALSQASDSQVHRLIQGPQQSDEILALRRQVAEQGDQLELANRKVQVHKDAAEKAESQRDSDLKRVEQLEKYDEESSRLLQRAKQEVRKATNLLADSETSAQEDRRTIERLKTEAASNESKFRQDLSDQGLEIVKLQQSVEDLETEKKDLEAENSQLKADLKRRNREFRTLEHKSERAHADADLAHGWHDVSEKNLKKTQATLETANADIAKLRKSLTDTEQKATDADRNCSLLRTQVSEQLKDLESKDRQIKKYEVAIDQRDEAIQGQVQQASVFLQHLSIDLESEVWTTMAEKILEPTRTAPVTSSTSRPWKICSSWSTDVSLQIRPDARSLDAIAIDVLAVLDAKDADAKDLLGFLQAMQDAMSKTSSISAISQLLLGAFTKSVGDSRLHVIHRVAMSQLANLVSPTAEALL
ncbi:Ff.00g079220.m01.CDS01 [Fusarium sp. VM40]|nr:Ff.00g079220.m01.CDS01 [Fusarium sp. VM40]